MREHAHSLVGTNWVPPRVPFSGYHRLLSWGVKLLFRVTPIADIYAVVRKISALVCNRTGISLRLTRSLFITLTEVLRLYLNLCIIPTHLFLLSRSRHGCEFLAESRDFYHNILFPSPILVQTEGKNDVCYRFYFLC